MNNKNKKKNSKLITIIIIVLLVILAILAIIRVFNYIDDSKKESFKEEIQKIYNKATSNINESSIVSSPIGDTYCKKSNDLTAIDLVCPTDSKQLDIDTNKSYLIVMDSRGIVNYISIVDNEFVYGKTGVLSVDEIKKEHVYNIDNPRIKDKFVMVYGITPEGKVNTTDYSTK